MTDYISRADAIEAVCREICDTSRDKCETMADGNCGIIQRIEALPSADAVTIHEDGTLEVKVPNATKVGRVLVVDTDSHIGGGLFYPADAEQETVPTVVRVTMSDGSQYYLEHERDAIQADAVQGEWIRVGHDIYECSLCHQNVMTKDIDCYSYCHRCGARMQNGFKSVGQAWNTDQGNW